MFCFSVLLQEMVGGGGGGGPPPPPAPFLYGPVIIEQHILKSL